MREGTFLGYKVNADGLKVCPDKVEAVLSLPSLKCLKDVQRLNGKLASLNRFLSKSTEKSLPFFKTLKKYTKKSDFQWTTKAKTTFKQMKKLIAELHMLTAPKEKEELIIYLAAAKEAISAVLMTERDGKKVPIYFVCRALQGPKINYTPMEKLILALVWIKQKSRENRQKRANTDTGNGRAQKKPGNHTKVKKSKLLVNSSQTVKVNTKEQKPQSYNTSPSSFQNYTNDP
ncbi:reverse transcriptase domain-containing protein [Tanacetum coccineum]